MALLLNIELLKTLGNASLPQARRHPLCHAGCTNSR